MGGTTKFKVQRVPAGIRVQRMPDGAQMENDDEQKSQSEQTSKSKCFIISFGELQRPASESFLKNNFKTVDGRTPEPSRFVYDRIYSVCPVTEEGMRFLTADVMLAVRA